MDTKTEALTPSATSGFKGELMFEEEDKPCSCLECEREREREERDFYTVKIRIVEEGANV
jgi:hypothetical protein